MAFMTVQDKAVTKHELGSNEFRMKLGFIRQIRDTCPKGSRDFIVLNSVIENCLDRQSISPNQMDMATSVYIKHKIN